MKQVRETPDCGGTKEIRAARPTLTCPEIMKEFNVSRQTVANLLKGWTQGGIQMRSNGVKSMTEPMNGPKNSGD